VPEPICLLARGESFNRRNSLVLLIRGFCLFRANEWTSPGAGAAGGMIGDRVVVSELRGVELPAGSLADLTFRCPPVTVVVRVVQVVCGPSAAPVRVPVPSGRGRLRRSGPPRPGTDRPAGHGKADASLEPTTPCLQSQIGGVRHLR
jgi:hypothetical protein